MPKRNWLAAIALGLIVLGGISVAAFDVWQYRRQHAEQREGSAGYTAADTDEGLAICTEASEGFFARLVCTIKAIDANREAQRAQHDLQAQQDMARWAYAVFLTSVTGLFISAIGLAFLFWSLRQTQEAIRDNKKIGQDQTAAYLSIEGGHFNITKTALHGWIDVRNYGQSPAERPGVKFTLGFETKWYGGSVVAPMPIVNPISQHNAQRRWHQAGATRKFYFHWTNATLGEQAVRLLQNERFDLVLRCHLEWRDVFGNRRWIESHLSPNEGFIQSSDQLSIVAGGLHVRDYQHRSDDT